MNVENDQTPVSGTPDAIIKFLTAARNAGLNSIGYVYDLGNWAFTGFDAVLAAKQLAPYCDYIHLKTPCWTAKVIWSPPMIWIRACSIGRSSAAICRMTFNLLWNSQWLPTKTLPHKSNCFKKIFNSSESLGWAIMSSTIIAILLLITFIGFIVYILKGGNLMIGFSSWLFYGPWLD